MARVEEADVLASEPLHAASDVADVGRCCQHMDVIIHQYVRMQLNPGGVQCVTQQFEIPQAITIIKKTGQPVVAALHDVLRNAWEIKTRKASHASQRVRLQARGLSVRPYL